MKKAYNKPFIMVELFQLNAALAASCSSEGKEPIHYSINSCTAEEETPGAGYIGASCEIDSTLEGGDGNDGPCYHGPINVSEIYMNS